MFWQVFLLKIFKPDGHLFVFIYRMPSESLQQPHPPYCHQ